MLDREKVIEGLQNLIEYLFHEYKVCYHVDEEDCYNRFLQANNAMNLLKEQEPKLVKIDGDYVLCPSCGNELFTHPRQKFCDECGQAVKWE